MSMMMETPTNVAACVSLKTGSVMEFVLRGGLLVVNKPLHQMDMALMLNVSRMEAIL